MTAGTVGPEVAAVRFVFSVAVNAVGAGVGAAGNGEVDVVENPLVPARVTRSVAELAVGRETGRSVIGVSGAVVILDVTACAVGGGAAIDPATVARAAIEGRVDADQLVSVREFGIGPGGGLVAGFAVGREAGRG